MRRFPGKRELGVGLNAAAKRFGEMYGVEFVYRDFRPNFRAGNQRARELGFYMQKYCGCVFSEADQIREMNREHRNIVRREQIENAG